MSNPIYRISPSNKYFEEVDLIQRLLCMAYNPHLFSLVIDIDSMMVPVLIQELKQAQDEALLVAGSYEVLKGL